MFFHRPALELLLPITHLTGPHIFTFFPPEDALAKI
jgi:hypothetical protein